MVQVVVYLGGEPLTMQPRIEKKTCDFRYEILNLQEVPAQAFLNSPRTAERALAVLAKSADPRETIERILASWKTLAEKEMQENIDRLQTLSRLRNLEIITLGELEKMPFDLDITESEIYKMGAASGATETARKMLSRLLEQRFGPLSRTTRKRLKDAELSQLNGWAGEVITARTLADVFAGKK